MASLLGQPDQSDAVHTAGSGVQRLPSRAHDPSAIPHSTVRPLAKASEDDYSTALDFVLVNDHHVTRRSPDDHSEKHPGNGEFRFDGGRLFLLLELVRRVLLALGLFGVIARTMAQAVHTCKATIAQNRWSHSNAGCESDGVNLTAVEDILLMTPFSQTDKSRDSSPCVVTFSTNNLVRYSFEQRVAFRKI